MNPELENVCKKYGILKACEVEILRASCVMSISS